MLQLLTKSIFILLTTLMLTGCGPMMMPMMNMSKGKCGGMMNMSKKSDMKCSSDKALDKTKK